MLRTTLVLAVMALACHQEPATLASPSNRIEPPPAAPASSDELAFLPRGAATVTRLDVRALRASALWAEYQPVLVTALGSRFANLKQSCGFDPLEAVESITIGSRALDGESSVFVVRGLDRDRTLACLAQQVIPGITASNDGGVVTLAYLGGGRAMLTFVDRSTLVFDDSPRVTKTTITAVAASGAPLRDAAGFLALHDRLEPRSTLWAVISDGPRVLGKLVGSAPQPLAAYGTLTISGSIEAKLHLGMATVNDAVLLAAALDARLHPLSPGLARLTATADEDHVVITAEVSATQLRQIFSMAKSMLGLTPLP